MKRDLLFGILEAVIFLSGVAAAACGACPNCWGLQAPCEVCRAPRKFRWALFRKEIAWALADAKRGG